MSPSPNEFPASYDRLTKITSAAATGVLLAIAFFIQQAVFAIISFLIVGLAYAYSPRRYAITEGAIVVKRLIGDVRFPLPDIRQARRATAADLRGTMRLWGSGGMFGYYGLFRTSSLGKCWWYVTNRKNMVLVTTGEKTLLFSPDDVDRFLAPLPSGRPVPGRGRRSHPADSGPRRRCGSASAVQFSRLRRSRSPSRTRPVRPPTP